MFGNQTFSSQFLITLCVQVTVVEDSVMATADATEGVVINRPSIPQGEATMPGNQLVLSSPVPKVRYGGARQMGGQEGHGRWVEGRGTADGWRGGARQMGGGEGHSR